MINLIVKLFLYLILSINLGFCEVLAFPQTNSQITQLQDLFKAIQNLDTDKIKQITESNPNLINMQDNTLNSNHIAPLVEAVYVYGLSNTEQKRKITLENIKILLNKKANPNAYITIQNQQFSLLNYFILLDISLDKKLKIIDFLVKNGRLNLNQICTKFDNIDLYAPAIIIANMPVSKHRFELFDFFVKHKVNINNALYSIVITEMGAKADKFIKNNKFDQLNSYIKSDEYQQIFREEFKFYIYKIFKNYSISDFQIDELVIVGKYFVYTNDLEFIKLMIDNKFMKNKTIYNEMLKLANELKNNDLINLLKGVKNG